jgi:hypothetical protein
MNSYNQQFAAWLALGTFLAFAGVVFWVGRANKDTEVGKVFMRYMIQYPISVFFVFLGFLNLSEAALAAAAATETTNVVSRFFTHLTIGVISLAAGLVWIKEMTNLKRSFFVRPFSTGRVLASITTASITSAFSIGLPIINMFIILNGFRQIVQTELFMAWLFAPEYKYLSLLTKYSLPITYSPFQAMSPASLATITATWVHIGLVMWEAAKAALITDKGVRDALYSDIEIEEKKPDDKGKKGDDKGKEKEKEKDKEKEKEKQKPFESSMEKIFSFLGYKDAELTDKVEKARKIKGSYTEPQQIKVGQEIANMRLYSESWDKKFADKDIREDKFKDKAHELQSHIVTQLAKGPSNGGMGLTVTVKN